MNKKEVIELMRSSTSESEWNKNSNIVKISEADKIGDYPDFWYSEIILSGLLNETRKTWKD